MLRKIHLLVKTGAADLHCCSWWRLQLELQTFLIRILSGSYHLNHDDGHHDDHDDDDDGDDNHDDDGHG